MDPEHLHVRGYGGRRPGQLRGRQRRPAGRQGQEREVEPGRHHQLGHRLRGQVARENISVLIKIFDKCVQEPARGLHQNLRVQELDKKCDQLK